MATSGKGLQALRDRTGAGAAIAQLHRQIAAEQAAWQRLDAQLVAHGLKGGERVTSTGHTA